MKLEEGSDTGRTGNGSRAYYGGWDYCSSSSPCPAYEGDCDSDMECQVKLSYYKFVIYLLSI